VEEVEREVEPDGVSESAKAPDARELAPLVLRTLIIAAAIAYAMDYNMGPIRTAQLAEPNPSLHKPCRRRYPALLPRLRTGRPNRPVTT
jgi:hypothetical protein